MWVNVTPAPLHENEPCWRPWLALAAVLIRIAYGPSLAHLSRHHPAQCGLPGLVSRAASAASPMTGLRAPPDLAAFFEPRSVAVVGASRDPTKVGGSVVANLRAAGFEGRIWPVNPRADVVQGLPATPSLLAIDGPVDLAVIAVPAPAVLPALKECVAKGVRGAVVISAGFREAGEAGRAREAELRAWLGTQPIRVLGPNCLGWIRPSRRLNATFAPGMPLAGRDRVRLPFGRARDRHPGLGARSPAGLLALRDASATRPT